MLFTVHASRDQQSQRRTRAGTPTQRSVMVGAIALAVALSGCAPGSSIQSRSGPTVSSSDESAPDQSAPDGSGQTSEPAAPEADQLEADEEGAGNDLPAEGDDQQAPESQEAVGDPIPDGASVEQIKAVMEDMHGPTNNIAGQVTRIAPFPDLPTPLGANLREMSARTTTSIENRTRRVGVTFTATAAIDDLVIFYETSLASFDWDLVSEIEDSANDGRRQVFTYEYDNALGDRDSSFSISLTESKDGGTEVQLEEIVSAEASKMKDLDSRLASWRGDAPIPEGGELDEWSVQSTKYTGYKLRLSAKQAYEGQGEAELLAYVTDNLPTDNYSFDEERTSAYEPPDGWVYGQSDLFEEVDFRTSEFDYSDGSIGFINIEGNVDFVPNN